MCAQSTRNPIAVTFGCAGYELTDAERTLFREADPVAFVLFKRNCRDPEQLRALTESMREAVGRDAPILIDQEGGRVQRLRPPAWPNDPPAAAFGRRWAQAPERAVEATRLLARAIAADLRAVGVDVNAAPVLDLAFPFGHEVIGDRAWSGEVDAVIALGRAMASGLLEGGVAPIIKHLPGHGRALADSHKELPVVEADAATLAAADWKPFQALADLPWGMTAHILYPALDPERPATQSARIVREVIREAIGFQGVLVSDDLSMEALEGGIAERAQASLAAGCDIALHCNGRLDEMEILAAEVPPLTEAAADRLARIRPDQASGFLDNSQALRREALSLLGSPAAA